MWAVFLSGWCFGCCFKSGRLIVFFFFPVVVSGFGCCFFFKWLVDESFFLTL